jgi:hypothetical protein
LITRYHSKAFQYTDLSRRLITWSSLLLFKTSNRQKFLRVSSLFWKFFLTPTKMQGTRQFLLQLVVIFATGAIVCISFNLIFVPIGAYADVIVVINVVIIALIIFMACVLATVHFLQKRDHSTQCSVSKPSDQESDSKERCGDVLCPICLCSLDDPTTIYRMNCCLNGLHTLCLQRYVRTFHASNGIQPVCVLCRTPSRSLLSV